MKLNRFQDNIHHNYNLSSITQKYKCIQTFVCVCLLYWFCVFAVCSLLNIYTHGPREAHTRTQRVPGRLEDLLGIYNIITSFKIMLKIEFLTGWEIMANCSNVLCVLLCVSVMDLWTLLPVLLQSQTIEMICLSSYVSYPGCFLVPHKD